MIADEKEAELRSVYDEMDEGRREKMEFLAVSLLNAQKAAESDTLPAPGNQKKEKNNPT
jgi:hypothetical protein